MQAFAVAQNAIDQRCNVRAVLRAGKPSKLASAQEIARADLTDTESLVGAMSRVKAAFDSFCAK